MRCVVLKQEEILNLCHEVKENIKRKILPMPSDTAVKKGPENVKEHFAILNKNTKKSNYALDLEKLKNQDCLLQKENFNLTSKLRTLKKILSSEEKKEFLICEPEIKSY